MLSPEERALLVDAVRADPGYQLDHALITTYSLDLDALLAIPLALTFESWSGGEEGWSDGSQASHVDPVALLESLRRQAKKLTVLSQAGAIAVPRNQTFLSFLEPVVQGVTAPRGGVFHPKFWLLRYAPDEAGHPIRYRVLVLSRNLTFDSSWDTLLRLDADLIENRSRGFGVNRPLRKFVSALVDIATDANLDPGRRRALKAIAEETVRLRFELPEGVEEFRFWPLGIDRTSVEDVFAGRRDRTLVVSPFLAEGFLDRLEIGSEDILISSDEELSALPAAVRDRIGSIEVLEGVTTAEPEDSDDFESTPTATAEDGLDGLHAKLFVADAGWNARIWTGSANATNAAFGTNVEFLVELGGRKSGIGIDAVLGDGLADLVAPFEYDAEVVADSGMQELERALDRVAQELGAAPLWMQASSDAKGWALTLVGADQLPSIPKEFNVSVWPATLKEHRAKPLLTIKGPPKWDRLDVVHLTGFLCLEVSAVDVDKCRRVAIAMPLEGAPDERDAAIVRSVLADPARVLRYLLFLLGDHSNVPDALELLDAGPEDGAGLGPWLGFGADSTLLEALVRSLHREPERIDRVEQLLADLGDGVDLLPEGFDSIFSPVREVRRRARESER